MDLPNRDEFWDHVEKLSDGRFKCKFCGHGFAADTSISRIKWHLSGEKGHGVRICKRVPQDVQAAAKEASGNANKRRKTMADSSNINEGTDPASTFPQQKNENANLTAFDALEMEVMEDPSPEQEVEEGNISCAEEPKHIESRTGETSQHIQRSIRPETLPVDENETAGAAMPPADIVSRAFGLSWEGVLNLASSAALQPLSGKPMSLKLTSMEQEYSELKEWKRRLLLIQEVLDDAEEKQLTNQKVKIWLSNLRDWAYDVEDLVDEFETEALLIKSKGVESQASTSTVQDNAMPNTETRSKLIENITARLKEIIIEKNVLGLGTSAGGRSNRVYDREPTASLVKEPKVYGRRKDKEAILEFLKNGGQGDLPYSVIPITGMGGIGKTTLAQLIYNDETIQFDCKAWVCVSDDYDVIKITRAILQHWGSCQDDNLNVLQVKLKEKLSGKKFLIVLDDVWERKYEKWTNLCGPFAAGAFGSKIIVTSRSEDVLSKRNSVAAYKLEGLQDDECLRLFARHALDRENFDAHPDLKAVGEKIIKRCKGLPLAAKTLGGLLHSKESNEEWEDILNSKIWDLPEEESDILPALRLSYYHLPSRLKQCFSYCAIFPKDYEFEKEDMVLLWMAEGFLQQPEKNKQGQDLGHAYFKELLSRSFFQECRSSNSSNKSRYVMHDLMSDLAQFVSGDMWFQLDDNALDDNARGAKSYAKVRHSAFIPHHYNTWQRLEVFHEMKSLRTFISLPPSVLLSLHLSRKVLDELLPKLKCLRSLSLAGYHTVKVLTNSILALKHLRYLNLSKTSIETLPESLGELLNLQTLNLCCCDYLVELPACIGNLINLECLDVSGTHRLRKMPPEISKLKNLVTLPKFVVGEGSALGIGELKKLPNLRGQLHIFGLCHTSNIREAKCFNLKEKQGLDELHLEWSDELHLMNFHYARSESHEYQVLNSLQPHQSLRKLSVACYGGSAFPSWVGDPIFPQLLDLKLYNCRRITSLPSFGKLPALRILVLVGMNEVKEVAAEGFPSLETLIIEYMEGWEQWSWSNGLNEKFPKLHRLTLKFCPRFVGNWPICLPSLRQLEIGHCPQLADLPKALPSLCELCVKECKEAIFKSVHHFTSLTKLTIFGILTPVSFHEGFVQALDALEDLIIHGCCQLKCLCEDGNALGKLANLKSLCVWSCEGLVSLVGGDEGLLPRNLQVLEIIGCDNLEKLPNGLYSLTSLRKLKISACPRLVSFPEGAGLPCCLKSLTIEYCDSLESLPYWMTTTMMDGNENQQCLLEKVSISNCPSLKYFPTGRGGRLPTTLKQLVIWKCDKLEFPEVSRHCPSHLEDLSVSGFEFPTSLKTLDIWYCKMQKSFPSSLNTLSRLTHLTIGNCDLEMLPKGGLLLPNLIQLELRMCTKLRRLPNHMENLTSLQSLSIQRCSSLDSFPLFSFPPNLTHLQILDCKKLTRQPMSRWWGLHALTSLTSLSIDFYPSEGVDYCFPDEDGLLLPTSLTSIVIQNLKNLKSISKGIQHLTSLEELKIADCPNLKSLPKEGFPPSLGRLWLKSCPLLKEGCVKDKGEYWPIIAHIPLLIDSECDVLSLFDL